MGLGINELVKSGKIKAPIVIGRDHLDCGSVASPNRETESMKDTSDAVADWALLNAMVNTAAGATWVSIHNGGGVGIGYSQHAGMVVVADGTDALTLSRRDKSCALLIPGHARSLASRGTTKANRLERLADRDREGARVAAEAVVDAQVETVRE